MSEAQVVAFVHAKGSSTRVPGKNLRVLGDRPLVAHAIAIARATPSIDEVVIDSDSDEILALGVAHGAVALRRPPALASNAATGDDLAYWQASSRPRSRICVQVIPTAPFLEPASVGRAIALLDEDDVHSVAAVAEDALYLWRDDRPAYFGAAGAIPNSDRLPKTRWETTGLYANRTEVVLRTRRRMDPERCRALVVSRLESVDINTPEDFAYAEILWRGLHGDAVARATR